MKSGFAVVLIAGVALAPVVGPAQDVVFQSPPRAGLTAGRLPASDPTAGNVFVGGPSAAYQAVLAELKRLEEEKPGSGPAAVQYDALEKRIVALRRADFGEKPYDARLEAQLRFLRAVGRRMGDFNAELEKMSGKGGLYSGYPPPSPRVVAERDAANKRISELSDGRQGFERLSRQVQRTTEDWIRTHFTAVDAARLGRAIEGAGIEAAIGKKFLDVIARLPERAPPLASSAGPNRTEVVLQSLSEPAVQLPARIIFAGLVVNGLADSVLVQRIRVSSAVDDKGRSLVLDGSGFFRQASNLVGPSVHAKMLADGRDEPVPIGGSLTLQKPQPDARTIKLLEGEIHVYAPSVANGGIAVVDDFSMTTAGPVTHPLLAAHGIGITVVTAASLPGLHLTFRGSRQDFDIPGFALYVSDPNYRIGEILFEDAAGKPLLVIGGDGATAAQGGQLRIYKLAKEPPARAKLLVYLPATSALTVVPFHFEDVPLNLRPP